MSRFWQMTQRLRVWLDMAGSRSYSRLKNCASITRTATKWSDSSKIHTDYEHEYCSFLDVVMDSASPASAVQVETGGSPFRRLAKERIKGKHQGT